MGGLKHLEYVLNLMKFAFKANPLLYFSIAISLASVVIELLAMSALLPLFTLVAGGVPAADEIIVAVLTYMSIAVNANSLLWVFIALFSLRIVTQILGQSLSIYLGKRMMAQLGTRAFEQIITNQQIRDISKNSIGYYISLAGDESFRASTLLISLTQFVSTSALSILYFLAIARYSPNTAGLLAFLMLSSLWIFYKVAKFSHRLGWRQTEQSRITGSVFLDALNNIKTVRAFSAEKYVVGIHRPLMFGYTKILFLVEEISLLTKLIPVLSLLILFSVWMAWNEKSVESVGIAFIVTMIVYLMRFFPTVGQGVTMLMRIASDAKSGRDVTAILDTEPDNCANTAESLGKIRHMTLQDVNFAYDSAGDKKILNGINLTFESGKSYALTGKSGVGKSTLVDILLKFYLPTSGQLCINNEPISNIANAEVRKKIILVSQEAAIFDDTVNNNVCFGMQAAQSEIQIACELACIHDDIAAMPEGYNSRLHYQGRNLSGGQRQRIGLARALLRKPEILILDESTSALDKTTQERVIENILREYSKKIVIIVTHDPHIMEQVDEVVNLETINTGVMPTDQMSGKVN